MGLSFRLQRSGSEEVAQIVKCSELRIRGYVRAGKNVMRVIKIQLVLMLEFLNNSHMQIPCLNVQVCLRRMQLTKKR
jgi:hypothetical protein